MNELHDLGVMLQCLRSQTSQSSSYSLQRMGQCITCLGAEHQNKRKSQPCALFVTVELGLHYEGSFRITKAVLSYSLRIVDEWLSFNVSNPEAVKRCLALGALIGFACNCVASAAMIDCHHTSTRTCWTNIVAAVGNGIAAFLGIVVFVVNV